MVHRGQSASKKVLSGEIADFLRAERTEVHPYCFFGTRDPLASRVAAGILGA